MQPVNDLYFVVDQSSIRLECFGTGTLQWNSSTGLEIPLATSGNIYQSYDPTSDALSLVIRNFTSITTSTYTCMTDLTDMQNNPISESVLVTSCKWRERERERKREREKEREKYVARITLSTSFSTANPAVIIQSRVQYVLAGSSTTLEARAFASPAESAIVQWYHKGRLIDAANEAQYTVTSSGDIHMLTVQSVSEDEIGEYRIVVIVNGVNATDGIMLDFPGS